MSVLVTGGLGYIGSVFVASAVRAGQRCVVIDHDATKKDLLQKLPHTEVIIADLRQRETLTAIVARLQPRVVHHFAAHSAVGAHPDALFAENVTLTTNLIDALCACNSMPGLIFASSCSVYGNYEGVADENTPIQPVSAYGRSKADCERLLSAASRDHQLAALRLRYSNVGGASGDYGEQRTHETHLIPNLVAAALQARAVTIFGNDLPTADGTCLRDYVHVLDVVTAHIQAATQLQPGNCPAYNICAGTSHSNLAVVRAVERASGKSLQLKFADRRRGDVLAVRLANHKAQQELGFTPQHSRLATIVTDTYRWLCTRVSE